MTETAFLGTTNPDVPFPRASSSTPKRYSKVSSPSSFWYWIAIRANVRDEAIVLEVPTYRT